MCTDEQKKMHLTNGSVRASLALWPIRHHFLLAAQNTVNTVMYPDFMC